MDHPLKVWRLRQGLDQVALAEQLRVSQMSVSRYESGLLPRERAILCRIIAVTKGRVTPDDWFRTELAAADIAIAKEADNGTTSESRNRQAG